MTDQSRRRFLQTSAATVGAAGLVSTVGLASAQQSSLPAYAEFVPTGDTVLSGRGELELGTFTLSAQIELFKQVSFPESAPLQFEPFVYSDILLSFWQFLGRTDLAEPVLGSLSEFTVFDEVSEVDASGVPAERHTLVGDTSLYTGSFDTGAIESTVQDSDATETDVSGIYRFPTGETVTWGEGYLLLGVRVGEVDAIRQTGDGPDQPRYEESAELETLLTAVDHGGHTLTRLTDEGTLRVDEYGLGLDHSPLEGTTGYIGTLSYESDATEFAATTVARYPDEGSVTADRLSGMVVQELDSDVTTEGRSVRVTASYDRAEAGLAPNDSNDDQTDDGQNGDGQSGDGQNGDNDQDNGEDDQSNGDDETNGGDGETNETTDDGATQQSDNESSDDGGPGFGVATALSSLGGAGYLLKRRLGDE